ncbi:MAG: hypothetical protein AAGI68_03875 [Planctomycetota bacterium]
MAGNKLLLLIGSIAYIALLILQWMTYTNNIEFSLFMSIALLVQALAGVPVLLYALGLFPVPIAAYSKALFALVGILTISGLIGVPAEAIDGNTHLLSVVREQAKKVQLENELTAKDDEIAEQLEIAEDKGGEKAADFSKAYADASKKRENMTGGRIDYDKLKEEERQELRMLDARIAQLTHEATGNNLDLLDALPRNLLIVLAAFIMLVGAHASADVFDAIPKPAPKPKPAAPAAAPPADPPADAPDAADGDEEPTKAPE